MKHLIQLITIIFLTIQSITGQCNFKTTVKPEGDVIKYFNPKPVIRQAEYEVGISIYKNSTTNVFMLNISVLFKSMHPLKLNGDAVLQTSNIKGIRLTPLLSDRVTMNGREVAIGLYEITQNDFNELKLYNLKSVFFYLEGNLKGSTVTENASVLKTQLNCNI